MNKKIELAKKLRTLANEATIEAEREQAARMLATLMEKHSITDEQIEEANTEMFAFSFKKTDLSQEEINLVNHIVGSVTPTETALKVGREDGGVYIQTTPALFIEADAKCMFFLARYREELNIFLRAFIYKNDLAWKHGQGASISNMTAEELDEIKRVSRTMDGLTKHQYHKQIQGES